MGGTTGAAGAGCGAAEPFGDGGACVPVVPGWGAVVEDIEVGFLPQAGKAAEFAARTLAGWIRRPR
jgi:hypothetical protein